ncbi:MAG: TolC family protein [Acidobacteria bacterium]|nr:TolC family protein [Acidobacteriota bacterium]
MNVLVALTLAVSLRDAVEQAGKLNPDVAIARLRVVEAEAQAASVRANQLPQLNATVGQTYQTTNLQGIGVIFPGVSSRVGPYKVFDARPRLTQTIFDAGLISQIRAARIAIEQNRYAVEAARETTQQAVLDLYLQALQADSRIFASKARLETARVVLKQARDREASGAASKLDVARSEQEFYNEEQVMVNSERDYRILKAALARAIGMDTDKLEVERLDIKPLQQLPPAEAETKAAVTGRAELKSDEAGIRKAAQEMERARREYLPKVGFSGDFGVLGQHPAQNLSTYSVGVSASIPIWTSGRISSDIAAARARVDQAREQQRRTRLSVEDEARQSLLRWQAARETLLLAEKATAAARESVALARLRFEAGLSTNIDTVIAQGRLAEAEDTEIRNRYEVLRARASYARAKGDVGNFFQGM